MFHSIVFFVFKTITILFLFQTPMAHGFAAKLHQELLLRNSGTDCILRLLPLYDGAYLEGGKH